MASRKRTRSAAQLGPYKLYRPAKIKRASARQNATMRRRMRMNTTRGLLDVEYKFFDTSLTAAALTAPTDFSGGEHDQSASVCLTVPSQGDSALQRDGKQIVGKYLVIKGQIYSLAGEGDLDPPTSTQCYIAVVLDTQTNGAQLNSEDVFKNTGGTAAANAFPIKNLLFGKRFRILRDKQIIFQNTSHAFAAANNFSRSGRSSTFDFYIPLKNLKINFNGGTTSDVANVIDNSIHIVAFCNSTTNAPTLTYQARFRFIG